MATDDILGQLRDDFPREMKVVDGILFHGGFLRGGHVVPGTDDNVRAVIISKIPTAKKYFHEKVFQSNNHGGSGGAMHRRRWV